jgi:hypothetical protein
MLMVDEERLRRGLGLFEHNDRLGAFDAVLTRPPSTSMPKLLYRPTAHSRACRTCPTSLPDDAGVNKLLEG